MNLESVYSTLDNLQVIQQPVQNTRNREYLVNKVSPVQAIESINNNEFCEDSIRIDAYENNHVGNSRIHFIDWQPEENTLIARGFVETNKRGISRDLITRTVRELENYAIDHKIKIYHEEGFLTEDSRKKLPHIYRELGYEYKKNSRGRILTKTYG